MKVVYGNTNLNKKKNFTMNETSGQPSVSDIPIEGCYTLVMIDPDAGKLKPNDPKPGNSDRYFLHWLVTNISGGNMDSGKTVVDYQKPTPPPESGTHEYKFLLYSQPCSLTNGVTAPSERSNWSLNNFLKGKNLQLVAGTFMRVMPVNLNRQV